MNSYEAVGVSDNAVPPTPETFRPPAAPAVAGPRVLVVDDDPLTRSFTTQHLQHLGYVVLAMGNGRDALAEAQRQRPDGIVSEVEVADLDGFALCRALRADPALADVVVVLIHSSLTDGLDDQAALCNANAFVNRAEGPERLALILRDCWNREIVPPATAAVDRDALALDLRRQLDQQIRLNETLRQHNRLYCAASTVMRLTAEQLRRGSDTRPPVGDLLTLCVATLGLPRGALYLLDSQGRLALEAKVGHDSSGPDEAPETFFGSPDSFTRLLDQPDREQIHFLNEGDAAQAALLARSGCRSAMLVPVLAKSRVLGVMFLGSNSPDVAQADCAALVGSIASQIGLGIDIVQACARLAASERRHRAMMDQTTEGIFVLDGAGVIQEVNRPAELLCHRARDELVGTRFDVYVAAEDAAMVRSVVQGDPPPHAVILFDQHLEFMPRESNCVDIAVSHVQMDDRGVVLVGVRDMTQRNVYLAQKTDSVARLVGGLAHEFNNKLTIVNGNASMVLETPHLPAHVYDEVRDILWAGEESAQLTKQLLAYGRKQRMMPLPLNLGRTVAEQTPTLRLLAGPGVRVETESPPSAVCVLADRKQIEQILVNLAKNAREAMPTGGLLHIAVAAETLYQPMSCGGVVVPAGAYARIIVTDSGTGMNAATLALAFEPFFTTKSFGGGRGLGLCEVQGIVRQTLGHILLRSEPGHGSRCTIYLPLLAAAEAPAAARPPPLAALPGPLTILLVEDEPGVRRLIASMLRQQGYQVLEAYDGVDAVRACAAHPEPIHLLLTDVMMPRMGGRDLAEQLMLSRPDLPVMFMSGFSESALDRSGAGFQDAVMVSKPFRPMELSRQVREMLYRPVEGAAA